MTVTLSQESYDAMLDDIKKLRERNAELEEYVDIDNCIDFTKEEQYEDETLNIALRKLIKKANAFDEVLNVSKFQHEEEYADEVLEIINKYEEEQ